MVRIELEMLREIRVVLWAMMTVPPIEVHAPVHVMAVGVGGRTGDEGSSEGEGESIDEGNEAEEGRAGDEGRVEEGNVGDEGREGVE